MAVGNFEPCLRLVLSHEGGFVDHPKDPGGATNLGVTQRVWEEWVGRRVNKAAMRALTRADVAPLYEARYWTRVHGEELPRGLDLCVFDAAVNSGPGRAVRWLQKCLNLSEDGIVGPMTLNAARLAPRVELIERYSSERLDFLMALQTWVYFGRGWGRRVQTVRQDAIRWAREDLPPPSNVVRFPG